ncbi:hypothetical protein JFT91_17625 [Pseudomonas sp. TH08]|uniref:hypothetical protein n=1 Tax=unclassified Pseudomonas TaxID=196821 RepID=UPI0019114B9C|nr:MULTISPECIES: hypothetical protein [unclassified Pseudomonas]MBK5529282.1 hypothetical protein [Pseudomonas sp. TH06]MBK5534397.1 hypothetical protein [Pseudomonas sp. TH08]
MNKALLLLLITLMCRSAWAGSQKTLLTCPLSDGTKIALLATSNADGQRLFVKFDGKIETAFTDMPDEDFVGDVMLAKCAGATLIFALNYGSPYTKGVVLRKNPASGVLERIDFAEKALPRFLYLSTGQMRLVIPNEGYEVPEKYLVYDSFARKGQPDELQGFDVLPDQRQFTVIDLK